MRRGGEEQSKWLKEMMRGDDGGSIGGAGCKAENQNSTGEEQEGHTKSHQESRYLIPAKNL